MCTGAELALMAAAGGGSMIQQKQAQDQQNAVVAAQNAELFNFLDRNQARKDQAMGAFQTVKDTVDPAEMAETQAEKEASRESDMYAAIDSAPAAAVPTKGSAAAIIGDTMDSAKQRETDKVRAQASAKAKTASFGDSLFDLGVTSAAAGRDLGMIGGLSRADAALLSALQDLRGAEASLRNQPSGIGAAISGAAQGAGYYYGGK